jgi:hypothetical protein
VIRDPAGQAIDVSTRPGAEGESVTLTLDHTIQAQAEAVLRNTIDHWHAKGASAIVLDPRTAASSRWPSRRATTRTCFPIVPKDRQRNRRHDTYEPGLDVQARHRQRRALDGLVTPQTAFTLPYSIHVADRIIRDATRAAPSG